MRPLPHALEARLTRILLTAGSLVLLATALPAVAAPLCRDSKGLFTPCAGGVTGVSGFREQRGHSAHRPGKSPKAGKPGTADTASDKAEDQSNAAADIPKKPATVSRAHLCRDLKGLYKPC